MRMQKYSPLVLLALLSACGSNNYHAQVVPHPTDKAIIEIDRLVVAEKNQYLDQCYAPVRSKQVPNSRCQNKLFELVERRNGTKYSIMQLNSAAEEIFFNEVDDKIQNLINTNQNVRQQARKKFTSLEEIVTYYKQSYHFRNLK